jgi:hypothetical protein
MSDLLNFPPKNKIQHFVKQLCIPLRINSKSKRLISSQETLTMKNNVEYLLP